VTGDRVTGALTLTVRNRGPVPAASPTVTVDLPQQFTMTGPAGCRSVPAPGATRLRCDLTRLAVGSSRTLTIQVSAARTDVGTGTVGQYLASVRWDSYPETGNGTTDNSTAHSIVR
jgi:hypothetical protein